MANPSSPFSHALNRHTCMFYWMYALVPLCVNIFDYSLVVNPSHYCHGILPVWLKQ